jgi:hypothetical protein
LTHLSIGSAAWCRSFTSMTWSARSPSTHHLGFTVESVYEYRGRPVWAALQSEGAELMVTLDGDPIDPAGQGVLFYLYSHDLAALRAQLHANGIDAGEIEDGAPGPTEEMRVTDPDGYTLMVARIE